MDVAENLPESFFGDPTTTSSPSSSNATTAAPGDSEASIQSNPQATSPTVINDEGHSIQQVDSSAGPEANIKFDIRAHSAIAQNALTKALAEQANKYSELETATKTFEATPVYRFNTRATLDKASLTAKIKLNLSQTDTHFQQVRVDYLDALSRSHLSPEEQHEKYATFQRAVKQASALNYHTYSLEVDFHYATSKTQSKLSAELESRKTAAAAAEKEIQKLLQEIQGPQSNLRNNTAQNLKYREEQLSNPLKTEDEKARLHADISAIKAFQNAGGLESLSQPDATKLNGLFEDAAKKYEAWHQETIAFRPGATAAPLHEAELAFKKADSALITEIRRLGSNLQDGPPELRKGLTALLKHKEFLREAAPSAEAETLNGEIATLKKFLTSKELGSLKPDSDAAKELTRLIESSNEKYGVWHSLKGTAKAAEEADADVMNKIRQLGFPVIFYATENNQFSSTLPPTLSPNPIAAPPLTPSSAPAAATARTAALAPAAVSPEDLGKSLWKFAEKLQTRENSGFTNAQLASLQKFLALDETTLAALPPKKLKGLVDQMEEIKEKNQKLTTVPQDQLSNIQTEITGLENQFIEALKS